MTPSAKPTAYCVKCKAQREIADVQRVVLKNGTPALQGTCPICHTKLSRIVSKQA